MHAQKRANPPAAGVILPKNGAKPAGPDSKRARAGFRALLRRRDGQLRLVWLWLAGFAIYYLWNWGAQLALGALFNRIGLQSGALYSIVTSLVMGAGTTLIFLRLSREVHREDAHEARFDFGVMLKWLLVGLGAALAGSALGLMTDSLRAALPLSEPKFTARAAYLLPMCAASTLAGEVFRMDYLYEAAHTRVKRPLLLLLMAAAAFVMLRGWRLSWIGMLNIALQMLVCCMLHEAYGLASAVGLWLGWEYALSALAVNLGSEAEGGVWSLYHVSERWLTGGDAGLFCGLWLSAVMLAIVAYLWRVKGVWRGRG